MGRLNEWTDALPSDAIDVRPTDLDALSQAPPAAPRPIDAVLDELFAQVVPASVSPHHPGFMAYVPNTALFATAVADLLADTLNRYPTVAAASPGPARVEELVLRWFCEWVGYAEDAGGVLTSGGSMANLGAFVTARHQTGEDDLRQLRWYATAQTHHSNHKAARIAGYPDDGIVHVTADPRGRMDPESLEQAIQADIERGLTPAMVCASAGTTDTGAVDRLVDLAEVCARHGVWFHVDAAYGGFFVLCDEGKQRLAGIERADSITLDPHKGLGLPFGTGCLLVRDVGHLEAAHAMRGAYMPDPSGRPEFADLGLELSRSWRGLRVWVPLMLHGLDAFRAHAANMMRLARDASVRLDAIEGISIHGAPELSAFGFRFDDGRPGDELDALNQELLATINEAGQVFLSSTRIAGRFWLRVCLMNAATDANRVDALVSAVEGFARATAAKAS